MMALPFRRSGEADRARDRLEVERRVARILAGREDALMEEMERVLLAVADGAHDLVAAAGHAPGRLRAVGLGGRDGGRGAPAARFERPRRFPREPPRAPDRAEEGGARVAGWP